MTISIAKTACKTLIVAALGLGAAFSANASTMEEFQATFDYSRAQPVEQTYANFQRVAADACQPNGWISLLRPPLSATRKCEADLLDKAVEQAEFPALMAYHREQAGTAQNLSTNARD